MAGNALMAGIMQEKFQVVSTPPGAQTHDWATDQSARAQRQDVDADAFALPMGLSTGDQSHHELPAEALRAGFDRALMRPTDDQYTREHHDAFYDDVGGFCERNNMLDRM